MPPPPPPPQDAYADGTKPVPEAPKALTSEPHVTVDPTVVERDVLAQKIPASDEITDELTPAKTSKPVQGLTDGDSGSGGQQAAQAQDGDSGNGDNTRLADTPTSEDGKPGTPTAGNPEGENPDVETDGSGIDEEMKDLVKNTDLSDTPDPEGPGEGEAMVYLDRGAEPPHASIEVNSDGTSIHSEQAGTDGTDAVGQMFDGELSEKTFKLRVQLPNPARAQAFQKATEGYVLGPYDLESRSCVTYCVDVLRAGGVLGAPDASEGWIRGLRWIWSLDS